jgi:uncharacterized protein
MRIAVVGAGIAGLGCAWLLSQKHDVTLFEQSPKLGGHANTVDVETADGTVAVDTGFIVYNTGSYPNLIALFDYLDVPTATSSMSFAVSMRDGSYEYSGTPQGLFGQPSNLFRPSHWRMTRDIFRFFREARALGQSSENKDDLPLGEWLRRGAYSRAFIDDHIIPMGAAIWSTPAMQMMEFPATAFARFFANHGLLQATDQPEWRTVEGGSREYVRRVRDDFKAQVVSGRAVVEVARSPDGVGVRTADGETRAFDKCVIAAHADDALAMLGDADDLEHTLLSRMGYSDNRAVLHRDARLMPRRRSLWSSWNYIAAPSHDELCVSYWMNNLQPLPTREDLFVTLNPSRAIAPADVIGEFAYRHPTYDSHALDAQTRLWSLQGRRNTWFCGSYFGYGFHEDGLQSGLAVAEQLGNLRRPWNVAGESDRLTFSDRAAGGTPVQAVA